MESVSVSELNQQTARVLERIKAGESLQINEYGRPIARISPVGPSTGNALLDQLIKQGRVIPATAPGPIPPVPARTREDGTILLSQVLQEMREDERY